MSMIKDEESLTNEKESCGNCAEGCGCNLQHEHGEDCACEQDTMFITFDDGKEVECNIIGIFESDDLEYIAVNPVNSDEILIYRYMETDEDNSMHIEFIHSDEEYNRVTDVFYKLIDDEDDYDDDYDDYADEDEE